MKRQALGAIAILLVMSLSFWVGCGDDYGYSSDPDYFQNDPNFSLTKSDTSAPTNVKIFINNNSNQTNSRDVTLEISAEDDIAVDAYCISNSSAKPETSSPFIWKNIAQKTKKYKEGMIPFTLSEGNGPKKVYAWIKDTNNNLSDAAIGEITFNEEVVIITSPANADTKVFLDAPITATFNVPMDSNTINQNSFTLWKGPNNTQVTGNIGYDSASKKAAFTPENLLTPGKYEARLSSEISTMAGNKITGGQVWSFTTIDAVAKAIFYPPLGDYDGLSMIIRLSSPQNGEIYYTLDGSDPDPSKSTKYTGPFTIYKSQHKGTPIKALTRLSERSVSEIAQAIYTLSWWRPFEKKLADEITDMKFGQFGDLHAVGKLSNGTFVAGRWNNISKVWEKLGQGLEGTEIKALAVDSKSNVYVGGCLTAAINPDGSRIAIGNVAKWNGSTWEGLDSGVNNCVNSLAVNKNDNVYVGGNFTSVGSMDIKYFAVWYANKKFWHGTNQGKFITGPATAITLDEDTNPYVATAFEGDKTIASYECAPDPACYWQIRGVTIGEVSSIAIDKEKVVHIAMNDSSRGIYNVLKWENRRWIEVGTSFNGPITSIAFSPKGALHAAGKFTRLDGKDIRDNVVYWDAANNRWKLLGNGSAPTVSFGTTSSLASLAIDPCSTATINYVSFMIPPACPVKGASGIVNAIVIDPSDNIYASGSFRNIGGMASDYDVLKWEIIE